jgi:hypothetical protein
MSSYETVVNNNSTASDTIHVCQPASQVSQPAHSSSVRRTYTFIRQHRKMQKMQPKQKNQVKENINNTNVSIQTLYSFVDFRGTFISIIVTVFDIAFLLAFYSKTTQSDLPENSKALFIFLYFLYKGVMYKARQTNVEITLESTSQNHDRPRFNSFPVCVIFYLFLTFIFWCGYMAVFSLALLMPSPLNYITALAFIGCT